MKFIKRILLGLLIVFLLATAGFVVWAETPLGPAPEALVALQSDPQVNVAVGDYITFTPANQRPAEVGFIFYPGGRVDARSYAAPLHQIAAQGYFVALVQVPLNLAFFDVNAGAQIIADHPEVKKWVVGGHSLGGVAAELFVEERTDISGVVFWASYPADEGIKNSSLRVLTIYGTNDMAGQAKFDETKSLNPPTAQYVIIQGGNHGQFGDYGPQPGDNPADISRSEQQAQIVAATVQFLASFVK